MLDDCAPCRTLTEWVELLPKAPSLHAQWVRCGTEGCRCARGELHGPFFYLFWRAGGRQRKRYVRTTDVEAVRAACAARRLREHQVRRLMQVGLQEWRALGAGVREAERHAG